MTNGAHQLFCNQDYVPKVNPVYHDEEQYKRLGGFNFGPHFDTLSIKAIAFYEEC
jgi:hypothetical protein